MALVPRQHEGHDMSSMSMGGSGSVPGFFYLQQMFWAPIGAAIGVAALVNLLDHILLWQRSRSGDAKPKTSGWLLYATTTAISREIISASFPTYYFKALKLRSPPLGKFLVVMAYLITVCVFCFYGYDTEDQWSWEDIAYRCGCIALAQLPLVFLLAGKQNIIGLLTGTSYERLNWLHRWVARILWLTSTFHMLFWFRSWARYDYIIVKLNSDRLTQTGFASWCILTAVVVFSLLPVRRFSYEVFVISHLVLFAGVIGATMLHTQYGTTYVWICVALFFFDRLLRFGATLLANISFLHGRAPGRHWLWANNATLTPLPGNVTRITIDNPVLRWKPGQHVFLSCHGIVPLQSHPFSIASLPSDNKVEFIVQAKTGGTRRFHRFATRIGLPSTSKSDARQQKLVGIEGPYGRIRPLRQFDSICFLAGSTGATFTVPLLRDIVQSWSAGSSGVVAKKIRFVWVVKARDRVTWFQKELEQALLDVAVLRQTSGNVDKELDISIYITCDEELEASNNSAACVPPAHGDAEISTLSTQYFDAEKRELLDRKVQITSDAASEDGCGPDGGCCCKITVDDEGKGQPCCCTKSRSSSSSSSSSSSLASSRCSREGRPASVARPKLRMVGGRPQTRNVIRRVLEEADGESAVVVCGPQGLQDDVRRSVVALSDERAIHKGTGAQGVYLHVEGFSY